MLSSHNSLDQLCMIPMEFREETMLLDLTVQSGSGSATAGYTAWATLGMLLCSEMPGAVGIKQGGMQ